MSEKVVLTREQASAVEIHKKNIGTDLPEIINTHINGWRLRENKCLDELTLDEFIRALYIGYEVEPNFKVGDYVHVSWSNTEPTIHKVLKTGDKNGIEIDHKPNSTPPLGIVRHATPEEITQEKERRWWYEHGRKVREYESADLVTLKGTQGIFEVVEMGSDDTVVVTRNAGYSHITVLTENLRLICPAEYRSDVNV